MNSSAISRLTEREKVCLRRWLDHQTAKEIALDLGISPHAVEKRLKMARTKLGLSSSLEAARLLAECEGYQRPGPQPADLVSEPEPKHTRRPILFVLGGIVMTLFVVALLAASLQSSNARSSGPSVDSQGRPTVAADGQPITWENHAPKDLVKATPAEILVIVQNTFHVFDKDHSGFLEGDEAPMSVSPEGSPVYRRDKDGHVVPTGEVAHQTLAQVRAEFYKEADTDQDGKVSPAEFRHWFSPSLARQGIPAAWKADMNRPVPTTEPSRSANPG